MPFREDSITGRLHMENIVSSYYKSIGYKIILLDSEDDVFNLSKSRNLAFTEYDIESIVLINSDCIISENMIDLSLTMINSRNCVVKPFLKLFRLKEIDENFLNLIKNNEIIDIKFSSRSNNFYPGGAFILNRNEYEVIGGFNSNITNPILSSMEFCLRSSALSELIFLNYDAYSFHHAKIENTDRLEIEKDIYEVNRLFLNNKKNIYVRETNNILNKLSEEENKMDRMFSLHNIF